MPAYSSAYGDLNFEFWLRINACRRFGCFHSICFKFSLRSTLVIHFSSSRFTVTVILSWFCFSALLWNKKSQANLLLLTGNYVEWSNESSFALRSDDPIICVTPQKPYFSFLFSSFILITFSYFIFFSVFTYFSELSCTMQIPGSECANTNSVSFVYIVSSLEAVLWGFKTASPLMLSSCILWTRFTVEGNKSLNFSNISDCQ